KEFLLENTSLSDTVKMQYLTNSLQGEARRLIIPRFSCTGTNLKNAWKLLKQKYGNEYTQKQRLVDKIITMRKPDSNSSSIIRFITDIESILMQMETLGMDTNTIEIITAIEKALPDRIRRQVAKEKLKSNEWSTSQMRQVLQEIQSLEQELMIAFRRINHLFPLEVQPEDEQLESGATSERNHNLDDEPKPRRSPRLQNRKSAINLVSMLFVFMAISTGISTDPQNPLVCSTQKSYWQAPKATQCGKIREDLNPSNSEKIRLMLFDDNDKIYSTEAFVCRITRRTVQAYTNLLGDQIRQADVTETIFIPSKECEEMIKSKQCNHGKLSQDGSLWHTTNSLDLNIPGRISSLFSGALESVVHNCFLFSTTIHARHKTKSIETIIGDSTHCPYTDGKCQLRSGESMIWLPDMEERCDVVSLGEVDGTRYDDLFIDESNQIALSLTYIRHHSQCYGDLFTTVQGIYYAIVHDGSQPMKKFRPGSNISPKFQYAHFHTLSDADTNIKKAVSMVCKVLEEQGTILQSLTKMDPTTVFRTLMNTTSIIARQVTPAIIEVTHCHELMETEYELTKT
uniref:Glycoprotein n=1 Tax=Bursaphelenchus xylophilus TaxID=6326 RepID=A0A1I7SJL6_BURXY